MAKRKLNYQFHSPNPVEVTAEYILKVMIEARELLGLADSTTKRFLKEMVTENVLIVE